MPGSDLLADSGNRLGVQMQLFVVVGVALATGDAVREQVEAKDAVSAVERFAMTHPADEVEVTGVFSAGATERAQ